MRFPKSSLHQKVVWRWPCQLSKSQMVCVHKITIKNFKLAFQVGSSPSVHPLIAFECIAMLPPSVIFVFLTKMIACVMCTVGGYPIPHGGGRGVFDELDDNLRSKHNQVWAAIDWHSYLRRGLWSWCFCWFYECFQVLVDHCTIGGAKYVFNSPNSESLEKKPIICNNYFHICLNLLRFHLNRL